MTKNKLLKSEEEKLFSNQLGLIDSSNIILTCGIENYKDLIQYIRSYNPKKIIQIIDARAPYIIKKRFGKEAFNELMDLIYNHKTIKLAPAKTESDLFLIQTALDNPEHYLITNDKLSDFDPNYIKNLNLVKFMFINSNFYFSIDLKNKIRNHSNKKIFEREKRGGLA